MIDTMLTLWAETAKGATHCAGRWCWKLLGMRREIALSYLGVDRLSLRPYSDEDIAFYLQVYRDYSLAEKALRLLRKYYPRSPVFVVSDGDSNPLYKTLVDKYGVKLTYGERLYEVNRGGEMIHRMLEVLLSSSGSYFVKMDPDTRIDRRFRGPPVKEGIYGTPITIDGCLQGGCMVYSRSAAERLWESKKLQCPSLIDWQSSWGKAVSQKMISERLLGKNLISYEWVLHWVCRELSVPTYGFSEIYSAWKPGLLNRSRLLNQKRRYAMIHPDKSPPI